MTPQKEVTLRSSSLGALLIEPIRSSVMDSTLAAKMLALLGAATAFLATDLSLVLIGFAAASSIGDYLLGRRLADAHDRVDETIAAHGLLIKLTAIGLLLFIDGMSRWVFSRAGWSQFSGFAPGGCAVIWIHREMKSIDRLTDGRIPFITPFLLALDVIIGRLLPAAPKRTAEKSEG